MSLDLLKSRENSVEPVTNNSEIKIGKEDNYTFENPSDKNLEESIETVEAIGEASTVTCPEYNISTRSRESGLELNIELTHADSQTSNKANKHVEKNCTPMIKYMLYFHGNPHEKYTVRRDDFRLALGLVGQPSQQLTEK